MAQIQKFQEGSGNGGIKPTPLKFKINGNDFEKDEQFVRDQFEPMFNELVTAGKAKARDRDQWKNSFQQYVTQARNGTFNIESSAGKVLNNTYTHNNSDSNIELGTDADGNTARKSIVGNIISPRNQNDAQRMAYINGLIGNRLVGAYDSDQLAAKTKADSDLAKQKADKRTAALDKVKGFNSGYGSYAYGQDFANSPELVYNKWYDKSNTDANRMAGMSTYYGERFKNLFDTSLDEYKDDADLKTAFNGRSLDDVRKQASQYYNPATGFTTKAKTLKDFSNYANVLDTMDADNKFQDKNVWDAAKLAATNASKTPEQLAAEKTKADADAAAQAALLTPSGKFFTGKGENAGRMFLDKEGKNRVDGWYDGQLWRSGSLYDGHYIGKDSTGNDDYVSTQTGTYIKGKRVDADAYNNWYHTLESNPALGDYRKMLDQRREDAETFYNTRYGGESAYVQADAIQDKDASDFILNGYKGSYTHAQNITPSFDGLKAGTAIAFVKDLNSKNSLGKPLIKNVIKLAGKNGSPSKTYSGYIKKDHATGKYKFVGEDGRDIIEASAAIAEAKENGKSIVNEARLFRQNSYTGEPRSMSGEAGRARKIRTYEDRIATNKDGGVVKFQVGGNMSTIGQANASQKRHQQANVKDIMDSTSDNYNLSSLDRWELGALAGDLTAVVASMTGAGSAVAGGLGVASTLTQGVLDYKRDGNFSLSDAGSLGVGLALDAASFVPGLGIISSDIKGLRTLTKASKWLIPALTAAGVVNAAGTIKDVVSGKKKLTELSVDDLRGLVNGIHGVVGLNRTVKQNLATENISKNYLTVKGGQKVPIQADDVAAIENATDKVAAAKEAILKNSKNYNSIADIELAPTSKVNAKFWNGGIRKSIPDSNTTVGTTTEGLRIKNIDNYQGDSFKDKYMRGAITKALNRRPDLAATYGPDNDLPVHVSTNKYGWLGDNVRKGANLTYSGPEQGPQMSAGPQPLGAGPRQATGPNMSAGPSQSAGPQPLGEGPRMSAGPNPTAGPSELTTGPRQSAGPNMTGGPQEQRMGPVQSAGPARPTGPQQPEGGQVAENKRVVVAERMAKLREAKQIHAQERLAIRQNEQSAEVQIVNQKQADKATRQAEVNKKLAQTQAQLKPKATAKPVQGKLFKDGGIVKAQGGVKLPYQLPGFLKLPLDSPQFDPLQPSAPIDLGVRPVAQPVLFNSPYARQLQTANAPVRKTIAVPTRLNPLAADAALPGASTDIAGNAQDLTRRGAFLSKAGNLLKGIDPVTASEFTRALWTRNQNSQIDTRVERPMLSQPTEVSVPVRGNLLGAQAYNTQANNIIQAAGRPMTSDAMLNTAGQLEANRNAGTLRAQGDMVNNEAIERTRGMALENDLRNNQARNNVANQNIQTLARARQAERGAENEKQARMNQPLADFWKDQNYKAMVKQAQGKQIDTAIALQGKSNNMQLVVQPLQAKYSANQLKMESGKLTQAEIDALAVENADIEKRVQWLTNQSTIDQLQTRKNPNYVTPSDWYSKGMPTMKEGGAVKIAVENQKQAGLSDRAIVKQHDEYISDGLKDESKKSLQAMKQIQELIKLALS